ncbi:hypothetical protein L208DRAFT_1421779 [Tricholoma matsutake]|nr:hypothetical protein L208DRAFT_1421779 [Tricholoma matsutake 945]
MRSLMEQSGLTEQEVRKCAVEMYGSLGYAQQAVETAEAENKAAIERAFPKGYAKIQVGHKSKPRKEVTFSQLRDDLMVWYILTPHDIRIYSVATVFSLSAQVLSIEQSLENSKVTLLTPMQPGVIPTGRLTSFMKAPFFILHSRTTLIIFSTYPCEPLRIPLWFSGPGEHNLHSIAIGLPSFQFPKYLSYCILYLS